MLAYTWEFGDGETAAGETVEHAFGQSGEYTVALTVVDSNGPTAETTVEVAVDEGASGGRGSSETSETDADGPTASDDSSPEDATESEGSSVGGPGFDVGTALASLGAVTYLLGRERGDDGE
mgnify:CR=1 FL=1